MKYQPIHIPEDLIKAINETDLFNNKIQSNQFDRGHFIVQDDNSHSYEVDWRTHFNNENNSEDESYIELDNSQHLNCMEPNKIVHQEDQVLLTEGSSSSTIVSATGLTSTSTFVQGLFPQYLHKAIITILCLHHLCKGISMFVYLLSSLQMSLRVSLHKMLYVISTKASLLLYTYYCLYLHL